MVIDLKQERSSMRNWKCFGFLGADRGVMDNVITDGTASIGWPFQCPHTWNETNDVFRTDS